MRIGIDATCWSNRRGFGRFTRELLRAVAALKTGDDFILFCDRQSAQHAEFPAGWRVVTAETKVAPTQAAAADGRRSISDMWAMRRVVQREPLDLMFFPAVYSYFPIGGRVPCLVTFHDVIAETLPHLIFESRRSRFFWSLKSKLAVRRANAIVTVSLASKHGLMRRFKLRDQNVRTVSEAPSGAFVPVDVDDQEHRAALNRCGLTHESRFLLSVGGISPHKNLDRLIDAFSEVAAMPDQNELQLVMVGDYKGDVFRTCYEELRSRAQAKGTDDRVRFAGYVSDDDLAHLYAATQAFVFPSYLEGFGLPAVEAMACGAPVIASTGGSLPEVLDGAGELFDPHDTSAIVDRIQLVLRDPTYRSELKRRSLDRARAFSWQRSATQLVELFHEYGSR